MHLLKLTKPTPRGKNSVNLSRKAKTYEFSTIIFGVQQLVWSKNISSIFPLLADTQESLESVHSLKVKIEDRHYNDSVCFPKFLLLKYFATLWNPTESNMLGLKTLTFPYFHLLWIFVRTPHWVDSSRIKHHICE